MKEEPAADRSMLGSDPAPSGRGGRANAVSAELSEIFSAVEVTPSPAAPRDIAARALSVRQGSAVEPRSRVGALGVAVAMVLVGAAVGVLVTRRPAPPTPSVAQPPAQALTVRVAPPPSTPAAPAPKAPAQPAAKAVADSVVEKLPPLPPQPSARRVARNAASRSYESALGIEGRALRRPAQTQASTGDPCAFLSASERARCLFPAIDDADRRLRSAYQTATEAGVPGSVLADYRRVWSDLRRRATREPYLVLDSYEALTDELNGYAADATSFNG